MTAGILSAEQDGPHVKFTMEYPDHADHCFTLEHFEGKTYDEFGNEVEVWAAVHPYEEKYIQSATGWHLAEGSGLIDKPPKPRSGRYRALTYRLAETSVSGVPILHTCGCYAEVEV